MEIFPTTGSTVVRARRSGLPELPREAGFLQDPNRQLRRGGRPIARPLVRQILRLAVHRDLRGGAFLLRLPLRCQGGPRDLRSVDDFLLGRVC